MCFESDGYPEFADDRTLVARKVHRCSECGEAIVRGDAYRRYSGKFDGHFFTEKVCRRCEYDRLRVVEHELAEGCDWSEAWPPVGDFLAQHLVDSGLGQTRHEDVPEAFRIGDLPRRPEPAGVAR